jgi:hypothetical protein
METNEVSIILADYNHVPPWIEGVAEFDHVSDLDSPLVSPSRKGTWRFHRFGAGPPMPNVTNKRRTSIVLVEIGDCDQLKVGERLHFVQQNQSESS